MEFFIVIIGVVLLVLVSFFVYTRMYNAKIDKQLKQGITNGKQWPKPETVVLVVFLLAVLICFFVESFNGGKETKITTVNDFADYAFYTSEEIKGTVYEHYTEAFESGELAGYEKIENTENNFHYIYFISQEEYNILHPKFILFVEYVGDEDVKYYMDGCMLHSTDDMATGSFGGNDIPKYHCVIGNMDLENIKGFSYTVGVFDNMEDMSKVNDGGDIEWSYANDYIEIWIE